MFSAMWHKFYDAVVRDVSPALRGGIIFGLAILGLVCLLFALLPGKTERKQSLIQNWFLFFLALILIILDIIYVSL